MLALHKALRPHYAKKFVCIGSRCEDTCCSGWKIVLDRASFDTYKSMPPGPLSALFDQNVLVNIKAKSDRDFGEIQRTPNGDCSFLSPQKLCSIQAEYGPTRLSNLCASYPRRTRVIDSEPETTLELSCPEAARQILLDPHFMQLKQVAPRGYSRYTPFLLSTRSMTPPSGNPHQYLWETRQLLLLILKDRTYPLWQRLFILGMFCQRMTQLPSAPVQDSMPRLLEAYAEIMQLERLRPFMDAIVPSPERQFTLAAELLEGRKLLTSIPQRFLDCLTDFSSGLGHELGSPPALAVPAYQAAHRQHFAPFLAKREFLFENYLVSSLFRRRFPFGDDLTFGSSLDSDPSTEFAVMALEFALLTTLATGMAAHYRENFSPNHIVKLIQSFSKAFDHNVAVRASMILFAQQKDLTRTDNLAALLRN